MTKQKQACPCGSNKDYTQCCGQYINSATPAPTAEALMRSRYTAFTLHNVEYLQHTWHESTRPEKIDLTSDVATKWIGLEVKRHEQQDVSHAIVEFIAKYKLNGRAQRLQETSRFVKEDDKWFYVDGDVT